MAGFSLEDVKALHQFHKEHFAGQHVPEVRTNLQDASSFEQNPAELDLGYYEDGTKRTLTDEQIAMFRHSEMQQLLAERQRQEESDDERRQKKEQGSRQRRNRESFKQTLESDETVHSKVEDTALS